MTDHNISQLIKEVCQNKCLYDQYDKQYRNVPHKAEIWETIAVRIGFLGSGQQLRDKWNNLRDVYGYNRKKLLRTPLLGNGAVRAVKWRFFNEMLFLEPHMNDSNLPWSNLASPTLLSLDEAGSTLKGEEGAPNLIEEMENPDEKEVQTPAATITSLNQLKRKRRQSESGSPDLGDEAVNRKLSKALGDLTGHRDETRAEAACKAIAVELKSMPDQLQRYCINYMQNFVYSVTSGAHVPPFMQTVTDEQRSVSID